MSNGEPNGRLNVVGLTSPGRLVYAPTCGEIRQQCILTERLQGVPRPEPETHILALHAECRGCRHKSDSNRWVLQFRPTVEASGPALEALRRLVSRPMSQIRPLEPRSDLAEVSVLTEYAHAWGSGLPCESPQKYSEWLKRWMPQAPWLAGAGTPRVIELDWHQGKWRWRAEERP